MSHQKELIPARAEDLFRHERRLKDLSIERVARETRIRPAILEAIESGQTSHIPAVYLKGYIRQYARYLGLDPADFEELVERVAPADPEVRSVFNRAQREGRAEKWLKVSGYLAASVVIATLAWQFTDEAVRFSQGDPDAVALSVEEPPAQEQGAARASGKRHLNASIAPVNVRRGEPAFVEAHAAREAWSALDEPQPLDGRHTLALLTSADTWVEIYGADDQQLEMDLVRAGERRSYRDSGPFRIVVGRASAVLLSLDGEAVDLDPHRQGDVASLVLANAEPRSVDTEPPPEND
jgi:cytoskeleton protein RodZ